MSKGEDRDDLSPSEEEESDEGDLSELELMKLEQALKDDPSNYYANLVLIREYRLKSDIEELQLARESFSLYYALSEEQWQDWLSDLEQIAGAQDFDEESVAQVLQWYKKALKEMRGSVRLWNGYLSFITQAFASDFEKVRKGFERAVKRVGNHVTRGVQIWARYIAYEETIESALSGGKVDKTLVARVLDTHVRASRRALAGDMALTHSMREWRAAAKQRAAAAARGDVVALVEEKDAACERAHTGAKKQLALVLPFEEKISKSEEILQKAEKAKHSAHLNAELRKYSAKAAAAKAKHNDSADGTDANDSAADAAAAAAMIELDDAATLAEQEHLAAWLAYLDAQQSAKGGQKTRLIVLYERSLVALSKCVTVWERYIGQLRRRGASLKQLHVLYRHALRHASDKTSLWIDYALTIEDFNEEAAMQASSSNGNDDDDDDDDDEDDASGSDDEEMSDAAVGVSAALNIVQQALTVGSIAKPEAHARLLETGLTIQWRAVRSQAMAEAYANTNAAGAATSASTVTGSGGSGGASNERKQELPAALNGVLEWYKYAVSSLKAWPKGGKEAACALHMQFGRIAGIAQNVTEMRSAFDKAVQAKPDNAAPWLEYANCAFMYGGSEKGVEMARSIYRRSMSKINKSFIDTVGRAWYALELTHGSATTLCEADLTLHAALERIAIKIAQRQAAAAKELRQKQLAQNAKDKKAAAAKKKRKNDNSGGGGGGDGDTHDSKRARRDEPEKKSAGEALPRHDRSSTAVDSVGSEVGVLFVSNLAFSTLARDLLKYFSTIGPVKDVRRRAGKAFAYVEYENAADATKALMRLDQSTFNGRVINVARSQPPKKKSGGGGGGGGNGATQEKPMSGGGGGGGGGAAKKEKGTGENAGHGKASGAAAAAATASAATSSDATSKASKATAATAATESAAKSAAAVSSGAKKLMMRPRSLKRKGKK